MTKKIFAMFLAVLMVVSMLPTSVFAANECPGAGKHTKDNCDCTVVQVVAPDCGNYGYTTYKCNKCKETFADSIVPATGEHSMVAGEPKAPTCGKPGYEAGQECEVCGYVVPGAAIAPLFKAGTACEYKDMTPDINCATGGVKTFECVACGDSYTKKVNKGSHAWDYEGMTVKVAPEAGKAGIVVVACKNCSVTKEIEWFPTHNCADAVEHRVAVAAGCLTDGNIEHYECRVCGKLYSDSAATIELRQNETSEYGGVIVKGGHKNANIEPSCNDKTYTCSVCKTKFVVEGKHVLGNAYIGTPVDATCTTKGYYTKECTLCHIPVVTEIPAKGHVEVTVSVPSTCHTYAYTFTACMRETCSSNDVITVAKEWIDAENGGIHYDIALDYTLADKLVANEVKYNLSFVNDDEVTILGDFYLEAYKNYKNKKVADAYRLYSFDTNGDKVYLYFDGADIAETDTVANDDGLFWSWNKALGILTFNFEGDDYFMAAMELAPTIFMPIMLPLEYVAYGSILGFEIVKLSYPVHEGTRLVEIEVDYEAGFNKDAHDYAEIKIPATCTTTGSLTTYCKNAACNLSTTVVLEKVDHKWNKLADNQENLLKVNGAGFAASLGTLVHDADCDEAGWHFEECEWCSEIRRVTDPAEGHFWNTNVELYQTANHKQNGYWYNPCRICGAHNIISNVITWAGVNKIWDTYAQANANHGGMLNAESEGKLYVAGSCTVTGLVMYTCSDCKKVVYVKQQLDILDEDGDPTGAKYISGSHVVTPVEAVDGPLAGQMVTQDNFFVPADCQGEGYVYTYTCLICGETIGKNKVGEVEVLKKTGHNFAPIDANLDGIVDNLIDPDAIENPCPNALPYSCTVCGATESSTILNTIAPGSDLCEGLALKIYYCSCGEEHIRGMYGAFGHDYVNYTVDQKPTHFTTGSAHETCAYCGDVNEITLPKTPHTNADGDKFTDACTDTETDRHCIECCKELGHFVLGTKHDCTTLDANKDGKLDCACMIGKTHHGKVNTYKDSTCSMMPYYFFICKDCDGTIVTVIDEAISSTELKKWTAESDRLGVDVYYFFDKTDIYVMDGEEIVDIELPYTAVNFKGHKPAKIDYDKDGNEIRYANYVYVEGYEWTSYNWELVAVPYLNDAGEVEFENEYVLVETVEIYTAKFEKFETPSYAADGGFKAHCQICDASVEQVLPKKAGLGFEMSFANANGQSGFGYGSLVEVTVSANALNANIYGFNFSVENNMPGMIFVGYEAVNDDFVVVVSDPSVAAKTGEVEIIGHAVNSAEGKMQNIAITEKTALVKLYYRVAGNAGKCTFSFADASAQLVKNATTKTLANIDANYEEAKITVRGLLDFNKDAAASVADLYQAMALLTGEMANGATYDVTVDLNKDGEVTLEDLSIGYNYLVGNISSTQLLFTGMDADETELFLHLMGAYAHKCISPFCDYAQATEFDYCPACGFKQN